MAAPEGNATDARAGALHLWLATESAGAVEAALPLLRALAATAVVVGADPRDACSARLARAVAGGKPRNGNGENNDSNAAAAAAVNAAAALRASGAAAAAVAAERRAMALERQLAETRGAAENAAAFQKEAADAAERALEADTRAVQAMESNAALRLELERASGDLEELVGVCNLMDEQLREASSTLDEAKSNKFRLDEAECELEAAKAAEQELGAELTQVQTILAEEMQAHRLLRRRGEEGAAELRAAATRKAEAEAELEKVSGKLQTRVASLEAELVTRFDEVRAAREATEQVRAELDEERGARSAAVSSGWEARSQHGELQRRFEALQGELAAAAQEAEWYRDTRAKLEAAEALARQMAKNAEEACDQRDDARRDLGDAYAEIERLDKMKVEFDLHRQRSEREAAAAGAAVETAARGEAEATRRAEKAEDDARRLSGELTTARVDAAAAEAGKERAVNELESTRSALAVANARRDSDAALAREGAERSGAGTVAAADSARADAESRARRSADQLTEATERADREANHARTLSGELAAARDDAKLARAGAANVAALEAQLSAAAETNARLTNEAARLEKIIAESYGTHNAVVCAATSAAAHAAERARADTMASERARTEAEAAGFRAASEVDRMAQQVRNAEAAQRVAEAGAEHARAELAAERTAGAAAHAALADIGAETARLAGEIDAARGMQARWAAGKQASRDAVALEESERLQRALAAAEAGRAHSSAQRQQHAGTGGLGAFEFSHHVPGSAVSAAAGAGGAGGSASRGWRASDATPRSPLFGSYY
jgi:hypothetical protein